ncbi:hypothetical protein [Nocardiopsis sp. CNR-923]|uniref:hypothetical protein n=1 Tax=Nocardiopsis sp. CNR-923 TaxID=1904965 RepID=UPI00373FDDE4
MRQTPEGDPLVPGVTELVLPPLTERAIHDILTDRAPVVPASAVRAVLVRSAHGNPAVVLSHLHSLSQDQLRGEAPLPDPLRLPERLRSALLTAYHALPAPVRHLLLIAALATDPCATLLTRASGSHSLTVGDLEPAEELGLVRVDGGTVVFPDPLLREAIAQDAPVGACARSTRTSPGPSTPSTPRLSSPATPPPAPAPPTPPWPTPSRPRRAGFAGWRAACRLPRP